MKTLVKMLCQQIRQQFDRAKQPKPILSKCLLPGVSALIYICVLCSFGRQSACCMVELGSSRESQCVPRFARYVEVCARLCLVPWFVAEQGARARPNDLLSSLPPPLSLFPSLSRSLQGCQSPAQPTGSRLEPWRRDQTAIPHLNASLLLLIGGNCLPDARALLRLLWGGGGGGSGGVAARPGRLGIN